MTQSTATLSVEVVPGAGRLYWCSQSLIFASLPVPGLFPNHLAGSSLDFLRSSGATLLAGEPADALVLVTEFDWVEIIVSGSLQVQVTHETVDLLDARLYKTMIVRRFRLPVVVETLMNGREVFKYEPCVPGTRDASTVRIHVAASMDRAENQVWDRYILIDERSVAYEVERAAVIGRRPLLDPDVTGRAAVPISIDGPSMSRTHLACVVREGVLLVRDMKSKNGSVIENRGTTTPVGTSDWSTVPAGAALVLGATRLEVHGVADEGQSR